MAAVYGRSFFITVTLLAALVTALVYGLGGLVISGAFQIGTLVALVTLLSRVYAPINQLSYAQMNVLSALVSFDRVFEVLDLKPLIVERPAAYSLPAIASANGRRHRRSSLTGSASGTRRPARFRSPRLSRSRCRSRNAPTRAGRCVT